MALKDRLSSVDIVKKFSEDTFFNLNDICLIALKQLSSKVVDIPVWFDYSEQEKKALISRFLSSFLQDNDYKKVISSSDESRLSDILLHSVFGFGLIDLLLIKDDVKTVIASYSEDTICIKYDGTRVKSSLSYDTREFSVVMQNLIKLSGQSGSVIEFATEKFIIKLLRQPVCRDKLIIEKYDINSIPDYNFEGLTNDFLSNLVNSRKKIILISDMFICRDDFIKFMLCKTDNENKKILFDDSDCLLNMKNVDIYNLADLSRKSRNVAVSSAFELAPDLVVDKTDNFDIVSNLIFMQKGDMSYVLSLYSLSPQNAVSAIAVIVASKLGITEKTAKTKIAKYFDYIIQVGNLHGKQKIFSINEVLVNKSGTPQLKQLFSYADDECVIRNTDFRLLSSNDKISTRLKMST